MSSGGKGYYLCQHPDHEAPLEIFPAAQYRKASRVCTGYRILAEEEDYDAAVGRLCRILEELVQQYGRLDGLKEKIGEALS